MIPYRFSKGRKVLLTLNLTLVLYLYYNGIDSTVRGLALALIVLCILSLYDCFFGKEKDENISNSTK